MDEIRKSISGILYERVTSPFYGTLIISWLIWNWKIPYVTLFVNEKNLAVDKLHWIELNALDLSSLLYKPVISTIVILTIMPFVTNGFYWLHLRFNKWKVDKRNVVEMKSLLTLEQSIALRQEVENMTNTLNQLIDKKDLEINQLKAQINQRENNVLELNTSSEHESSDYNDLIFEIINNPRLQKSLDIVVEYIQGGWTGIHAEEGINSSDLAFFEAHEIIESAGNGKYKFGSKGRNVLKDIFAVKGKSA